ncbi:MAG: hypothetical protein K2H85_07015, partial [Allobaculum sp.]|nr:hypothetical protein [Allobaculum sp.]
MRNMQKDDTSPIPEIKQSDKWVAQSFGNLVVAVRPHGNAKRPNVVTLINLNDDPSAVVPHIVDLWNCGMLVNACVQLYPNHKPLPLTPCIKLGGNWVKADVNKFMIGVDNPKAEQLITESGATLVFCNTKEEIPDEFYNLIGKAIDKRNPIYVQLNMDIAASDSDTTCFAHVAKRCTAVWGEEATSELQQWVTL